MWALIGLRLFTAAPAMTVEPNVPKGWNRLQPRAISASSFLLTGINRYEDNYLPLYAADDDASSAWVEGAPGPGLGESLLFTGPRLKQAKELKVFIRAGYQKSMALFRANHRPKDVRLEPLRFDSGAPQAAGEPVAVTLADQVGWQEFTLPVSGTWDSLRLVLVSVYPGSTYDDTCVSDVRVFVRGSDAYQTASENHAAERLREFIAARRAAAHAKADTLRLALSTKYREEEVLRFDSTAEGTQAPFEIADKTLLEASLTHLSAREERTFIAESIRRLVAEAKRCQSGQVGYRRVVARGNESLQAAFHERLPGLGIHDPALLTLSRFFDNRLVTVFDQNPKVPMRRRKEVAYDEATGEGGSTDTTTKATYAAGPNRAVEYLCWPSAFEYSGERSYVSTKLNVFVAYAPSGAFDGLVSSADQDSEGTVRTDTSILVPQWAAAKGEKPRLVALTWLSIREDSASRAVTAVRWTDASAPLAVPRPL